ncbi:rcc01693 family protein [Paracoccus sp. (in: a-proteobacteria)]
MSGRGLDWAGLLRTGLQGLRLRPAEFWELTPAELALMLGVEPGAGAGAGVRAGAMTRSALDALMARFPDADAGAVRQFKE